MSDGIRVRDRERLIPGVQNVEHRVCFFAVPGELVHKALSRVLRNPEPERRRAVPAELPGGAPALLIRTRVRHAVDVFKVNEPGADPGGVPQHFARAPGLRRGADALRKPPVQHLPHRDIGAEPA